MIALTEKQAIREGVEIQEPVKPFEQPEITQPEQVQQRKENKQAAKEAKRLVPESTVTLPVTKAITEAANALESVPTSTLREWLFSADARILIGGRRIKRTASVERAIQIVLRRRGAL